MSRTLRKQLFSIEDLLEKANKVLEKRLFASVIDEDALIELISDCQNSAISMGEQIEKLYGEGTKCVALLEQYCEDLYLMTQYFNDSNKKREIYNSLNKQLKKLRGFMTSELPDKLEVVFFPYKASMWDSLESVYLAAKEDPDCDAYCVPIPYFDRNADGSLGQMHYEGNEFPKNIEITNWESYNLEERRPDAIYIHNPYDEWNLVTCVHPIYFAKNLKQYTDKLVYIPYFVLDEIEPEDQVTIDGMKHFVWTPGVIYADKVVLQSEKMKQIYVNEYIKAAKENGLSGDYVNKKKVQEKFQGTGSPKIIKVRSMTKEEIDIPEEWKKVLQKPDGSWKKIVFYNTSIGALLQNEEKMIRKIQDVFRVFKENSDEIALLWRPHPLIQATIESMRPQLWNTYKAIVEQYKTEEWGIYDDTANMDRAVILSDAYYGDGSSVVSVYNQTKKPIMIQRVDILGQKEKVAWPAAMSEIVMAQDEGYGISYDSNMMFRIDLNKEEIWFGDFFPNEADEYGLYISGQVYNDKIYWIPYMAKQLAVYDVSKKYMRKYELPVQLKSISQKFGVSILYQKKIFAFGYEKPIILCIDCDSMNMKVIDLSPDVKSEPTSVFFKYAYCVKEDKAYLSAQEENMVLEFDMSKEQYKIHYIQEETERGYTSILPCERGFRLFNWNDEEIIWNPQEGVVERKKIRSLPDSILYKAYRNVIEGINEVKIPFFEASVYASDGETKQKFDFEIMTRGKLKSNASRFTCVKQISNYIFFQLNGCFKWFRLNNENLELDEMSMELPDSQLIYNMEKRCGMVMKETATTELNGLLMFIKGKKENE